MERNIIPHFNRRLYDVIFLSIFFQFTLVLHFTSNYMPMRKLVVIATCTYFSLWMFLTFHLDFASWNSGLLRHPYKRKGKSSFFLFVQIQLLLLFLACLVDKT